METQKEGRSLKSRGREARREERGQGYTLCYYKFHSGQNVRISQAAKLKASGAENTCGLVLSSLQLACVPQKAECSGHPGALTHPPLQALGVQVDLATGGCALGPLPQSWPPAQPPPQLCLWLLPTDCLHPVFPCVYKSA